MKISYEYKSISKIYTVFCEEIVHCWLLIMYIDIAIKYFKKEKLENVLMKKCHVTLWSFGSCNCMVPFSRCLFTYHDEPKNNNKSFLWWSSRIIFHCNNNIFSFLFRAFIQELLWELFLGLKFLLLNILCRVIEQWGIVCRFLSDKTIYKMVEISK